ncbi:hypothetical protein KIN20_030645 [Parelaphostrongylus tenuis]|uniref:Uncharacterized protein n=1 Tax=Parelaphostrongylus tenuis TaxID=148309 RepID=A0AAD5WGG6_PARTN|nr:hypothetical protein KIN20_030645 [Parelaphostrongylus tenuis]
MSSIKKKCQIVHVENTLDNFLSNHNWQIKDDPTEDYELLVEGLKKCIDFAPVTQPRRTDRISYTMKELLKKQRKPKLDPNAKHLERVLSSASCRRAMQKNLHQYRQKELLEATRESSNLKKSRWNLCDYSISL